MTKPPTWGGPMMGIRASALAALIFALMGVFATPASAGTNAKCDFEGLFIVWPGTAETNGAVGYAGSVGYAECQGSVAGESVKGTAPLSLSATSTDGCSGASGSVSFNVSPIGPKDQTFSGTGLTFTRTGYAYWSEVVVTGTGTATNPNGVTETFNVSAELTTALDSGNCSLDPIYPIVYYYLYGDARLKS